jgi:hypothetical protein
VWNWRRKQKGSHSFIKLFLQVASHSFCHFVYIWSKLLAPVVLKENELGRGMNIWGGDHWQPFHKLSTTFTNFYNSYS